MKKELDDLLCARYPKLFVERNLPMSQTTMCWGFSCGDGWFNIIDKLCANIQSHIDWIEKRRDWEVEKGKAGEEGMPRTPHVTQVVVKQVKEKFGTLRFYISGGDDYIHGLIAMAESMSAVTCEGCGDQGKLYGVGEKGITGWMHTHCESCEEARATEYAKSNGLEI